MDFPTFPHQSTFTEARMNRRLVTLYTTDGVCVFPTKNIEALHAFKTGDDVTKVHIVLRTELYVFENKHIDMYMFFSVLISFMHESNLGGERAEWSTSPHPSAVARGAKPAGTTEGGVYEGVPGQMK